MFVELLPILRNRPVMLTLALVGDNAIRVNVIPKRVKDGDSGDDALTTPLTVTGAPDELELKVGSPPYAAVMEWGPATRSDVSRVAVVTPATVDTPTVAIGVDS